MRRLRHSLKIAIGRLSRGCRDDSPVFSYRFARARARYLTSSLDGCLRVSPGALTIPVTARTKYIHPLVASLIFSQRYPSRSPAERKDSRTRQGHSVTTGSQGQFAEKKSRGCAIVLYARAKWPLILCGNSISPSLQPRLIPHHLTTFPRRRLISWAINGRDRKGDDG